MAVDARYRDKGGEISRKYGDALIGRLRAIDSTLLISVPIKTHMSLRERTRPGLGIIEPCLALGCEGSALDEPGT